MSQRRYSPSIMMVRMLQPSYTALKASQEEQRSVCMNNASKLVASSVHPVG
jgi:hypothetical protein